MAGTGAPGHLDPGFEGFPAVDGGFGNNYDYPMGALIGMGPSGQCSIQFYKERQCTGRWERRFSRRFWGGHLGDVRAGFLEGQAESDHYLRASLRAVFASLGNERTASHSQYQLEHLFSTTGPTGAKQGLPSSATGPLSFNLGGPANGKPGFYNWDKKDFGPRFSVAWSPSAKEGLFKSLFGKPWPNHDSGGGPALSMTASVLPSWPPLTLMVRFGLSTGLTNTGGVSNSNKRLQESQVWLG